ncbi:hypothetical protein NKH18_51035 [Streptomyces sp. M10(2022)]
MDEIAGDVTALSCGRRLTTGKRISLHLTDQHQQSLVMILTHQPGLAVADKAVLPRITELGASSCGVDTADDGRRLWAILDM